MALKYELSANFMENIPGRKRRFQFSLGALLMGVITLGACMGFYFTYRDNNRLRIEAQTQRAQNRALREEMGYLNVDDPNKAWVRSVETHETDKWKFRVYVPCSGSYQIGVQGEEVTPGGFDRKHAKYTYVNLPKGEIEIYATLTRDYESLSQLAISIPNRINGGREVRQSFSMDWRFLAFARSTFTLDNICAVRAQSISFDLRAPLVLLAMKAKKLKRVAVGGATGGTRITQVVTDEPGPGLIIWLEVAPYLGPPKTQANPPEKTTDGQLQF